MAQALTEFEEKVEPRLPQAVAKEYKAFLRRKFGALAADAIDVMKLEPGTQINPHAQSVRDGLFQDSSPPRS
jgi:hypothetical protein